jgi:ATP-dependent RNA helicase RhlE
MKGNAVSLVSEDETELLENIEKLLKFKLINETVAGFEPLAGESKAVERTSRPGHEWVPPEQRKRPDLIGSRKDTSYKKDLRRIPAGRSKIPEDPLFSQPYTPSIDKDRSGSIRITSYKHPDHLRHGHKDRVRRFLCPGHRASPNRMARQRTFHTD